MSLKLDNHNAHATLGSLKPPITHLKLWVVTFHPTFYKGDLAQCSGAILKPYHKNGGPRLQWAESKFYARKLKVKHMVFLIIYFSLWWGQLLLEQNLGKCYLIRKRLNSSSFNILLFIYFWSLNSFSSILFLSLVFSQHLYSCMGSRAILITAAIVRQHRWFHILIANPQPNNDRTWGKVCFCSQDLPHLIFKLGLNYVVDS